MKYYLHDSSAFDDEKVTELFMKYGYEGIGLFYVALEKFAKQEKPIKTTVLKAQLKVGKRLEKCWSFMEEIGLIHSNNGDTFNKQLLNYSETYQIKKENTRKKVSEWREKQELAKSVTSYETVSNPPKEKESKVNESKKDIVGEIKISPTETKKTIDEREVDFKNKVIEILSSTRHQYFDQKETNKRFYEYWSEHSENGKKMRFEKEPVFDIAKRLDTWHARNQVNGFRQQNAEKPISKFEHNVQAGINATEKVLQKLRQQQEI